MNAIGAKSIFLAFVLAFYSSAARAQTRDIKIALSSQSFGVSSVLMAKKAGLFEKNGLNADIIISEDGGVSASAMLSGSVDFGNSTVGDVAFLRVRGQNVTCVATLFRGFSPTLVLGKDQVEKLGDKIKASPAERIKALDGLSIAVPSAISSFTWPYVAAQQKYGIKINFVFINQPAMPAALIRKSVQAIVAASPFWEPVVEEGHGSVWLSGPKKDLAGELIPSLNNCLSVSDTYAKNNPDVIKRLRQTLVDVGTMIKDEPDRARKALAEAQPKVSEKMINSSFDLYSENWSHPLINEADMINELRVLNAAQLPNRPDISSVDPKSLYTPY